MEQGVPLRAVIEAMYKESDKKRNQNWDIVKEQSPDEYINLNGEKLDLKPYEDFDAYYKRHVRYLKTFLKNFIFDGCFDYLKINKNILISEEGEAFIRILFRRNSCYYEISDDLKKYHVSEQYYDQVYHYLKELFCYCGGYKRKKVMRTYKKKYGDTTQNIEYALDELKKKLLKLHKECCKIPKKGITHPNYYYSMKVIEKWSDEVEEVHNNIEELMKEKKYDEALKNLLMPILEKDGLIQKFPQEGREEKAYDRVINMLDNVLRDLVEKNQLGTEAEIIDRTIELLIFIKRKQQF